MLRLERKRAFSPPGREGRQDFVFLCVLGVFEIGSAFINNAQEGE
jgi:hypothetical protein